MGEQSGEHLDFSKPAVYANDETELPGAQQSEPEITNPDDRRRSMRRYPSTGLLRPEDLPPASVPEQPHVQADP